MRISAATIGFAGIVCAALLIAYRVAEPRQLVTDAEDQSGLWEGMATNQALELTVLAPTSTPYKSVTPTRTPKPPSPTPLPTFGPDASPGFYVVPGWTPTGVVPMTVEAQIPVCTTVTPKPFADQTCRMDE